MRYYLIAGEASGDLHGSNLICELRKLDKKAEIRCWGGDMMQQAGADVVKHYRELAFMGFKEVLVNIRTIFRNMAFCKQDILAYKPDALVLIDYPGFNIRMAEFAHKHGIKVVYYISPQVWAWKARRVKKLKLCVDKMLCIVPFEVDFYKKWNYEVCYVGHPLLDAIDTFEKQPDFRTSYGLDERPIIALLPGSRKQELAKMLPTMLGLKADYPNYQFVIAGAPGLTAKDYDLHPDNHRESKSPNHQIVFSQTYQLLAHSHAALVTSGTATLETALFLVPQVVCYRGSQLSYQIGKRLVNIKYISLVNLILDKPVVTELIQNDFTSEKLKTEFNKILAGVNRETMQVEYETLITLLGKKGASAKAAMEVVGILR